MATGYKIGDGRDLSDIFSPGDSGITTGYKTADGVDVGRQFMGGATDVVTGYKTADGKDLGSILGNDPWIAQGYTKCTMTVGTITETSYDAWEYVVYTYKYGATLKNKNGGYSYGSMSPKYTFCASADISQNPDTSDTYSLYGRFGYSSGSYVRSAVVNGIAYSLDRTGKASGSALKAVYDYLKAANKTSVTIYLRAS